METKEFNLSEKRKELLKSLLGMKDTPMDMIMINSIIGVIQDQDKEFIKILREWCLNSRFHAEVTQVIDNLAGDELK